MLSCFCWCVCLVSHFGEQFNFNRSRRLKIYLKKILLLIEKDVFYKSEVHFCMCMSLGSVVHP